MNVAKRRAGFTLIEMLAVVVIFALLASIAIPSLSTLSGRTLRAEADRIAGRLDLARQRAVMTGVPHRLLIDLDTASYALEWFASEPAAAEGPADAFAPAQYDLTGESPLPLAAPTSGLLRYQPLPGLLGRPSVLHRDVEVAQVETPDGIVDGGQTYVSFERDGSATPTEIWIDDDAGNELVIEVLAIADAVRIRHEPL